MVLKSQNDAKVSPIRSKGKVLVWKVEDDDDDSEGPVTVKLSGVFRVSTEHYNMKSDGGKCRSRFQTQYSSLLCRMGEAAHHRQ